MSEILCPECGRKLRLMSSYYIDDCVDYKDGYKIELFNCDECGSAWKVKKTDNEIGEPERYFFG